jgi:hypothetical protein
MVMNGPYRHPDKGGTGAGFRELKESYDAVKQAVMNGWAPQSAQAKYQTKPNQTQSTQNADRLKYWDETILRMKAEYAKTHQNSRKSKPEPQTTPRYNTAPHVFDAGINGAYSSPKFCRACGKHKFNSIHSLERDVWTPKPESQPYTPPKRETPKRIAKPMPLADKIIRACLMIGGIGAVIGMGFIMLILMKIPSSYYMFWL